MIFNKELNLEEWKTYLENLTLSRSEIKYDKQRYPFVEEAYQAGTLEVSEGDIPVFHLKLTQTKMNTRVKISQLIHRILLDNFDYTSALAFIEYSEKESQGQYRLSYVKTDRDDNKTIKSNPRRYTFVLGEGLPTHTPEQQLKASAFSSIPSIEAAFSVEPVNKEFYKAIQEHFDNIIASVSSTLNSQDAKQFTLRFLGRMLFCWFLREKKLIPPELLGADKMIPNYYQTVLEPLFFSVLNQAYGTRTVLQDHEKKIPFLNGGLFTPQDDDHKGEILIDDEIIKKLFETFELYNFTVDESTPSNIEMSIDPEMLGRVFENLLAEIDENTGESARKSTGSFYTPREIVDYMVVESLKQYFKNNLSLDDNLLHFMFNSIEEASSNPELSKKTEEILNAIHKIKILDPACGSGAFPMGILQRIFILIERIDPEHKYYKKTLLDPMDDVIARRKFEEYAKNEQFDYAYKMKILKDCIYGVDIQESATEISRLRAFLSLIVEEKLDDTEDNLGIEPLPNLQFQFITANSLVGLDIFNSDISLYIQSIIENVHSMSTRFFSADTDQKKQDVYVDFKCHLERLKTDSFLAGTETGKMIASWHPFKNKSCDFFDPHIQFGIDKDRNFDIVIANPPYVQIQSMDNSTKSLYQEQYYASYTRVGDLYQLFYERAFDLLSDTGVVAMITSNKWMRAGYGITTRSFFQDYCYVYKLLDLGSGRFESATVDTNIIFYGFNPDKNGDPIPQESIPALIYTDKLKNIEFLTQNDFTGSITPDSTSWIILDSIEASILDKMKKVGKPLKDWDISINRGVLTGFNEAFIIDGETKDQLIKEDPKSAEIIKPLLRGRDIKRYSYEFADKWLINTHNGVKSKNIDPIKIDDYPAIKKHLDQYSADIIERGDQGDTPYNLRNCAYLEDFDKPKIAWQRITDKNKFCLSPTGQYILDSMAFFTNFSEKMGLYLLGILNSNIIYYWIKKNVHEYGNTGFRLSNQYVEIIPIPKPSSEQEQEITRLVQIILTKKANNEDTTLEEQQIDKLVYTLYKLSDGEIRKVEGYDNA